MEALWNYRSIHTNLVGTVINIHNGNWIRRGKFSLFHWWEICSVLKCFLCESYCIQISHIRRFLNCCKKKLPWKVNTLKNTQDLFWTLTTCDALQILQIFMLFRFASSNCPKFIEIMPFFINTTRMPCLPKIFPGTLSTVSFWGIHAMHMHYF